MREAGFIEAPFVQELIHVHKTLCGLWIDRHGVEGPNQKKLSALTLTLVETSPKAMVSFYTKFQHAVLSFGVALVPSMQLKSN